MPRTSVGPTCADLRRDGVAQRHASHPLGPLMRVERAQAARGQGKGGGLRGRTLPGAVCSCHSALPLERERYLGISGLSLAEYLWRLDHLTTAGRVSRKRGVATSGTPLVRTPDSVTPLARGERTRIGGERGRGSAAVWPWAFIMVSVQCNMCPRISPRPRPRG